MRLQTCSKRWLCMHCMGIRDATDIFDHCTSSGVEVDNLIQMQSKSMFAISSDESRLHYTISVLCLLTTHIPIFISNIIP